MPFIVLLFGIGDMPAVVIIFIAAFFPVLLSTVGAVANIDPIYLKVSNELRHKAARAYLEGNTSRSISPDSKRYPPCSGNCMDIPGSGWRWSALSRVSATR